MPKKIPTGKKRGKKKPAGFDSWFEYDLFKKMKACGWKPDVIEYVVSHKYHPDANFERGDGTEIIIELKGKHRNATSAEMRKYLGVRDALEDNQELVFVLAGKNMKFPGARPRKDGTTRTYEEWMDDHGFSYYYEDTIPKCWSKKR